MTRACLLAILVACGTAPRHAPNPSPAPLAASPEAAEAAYDARNWAECAAQWSALADRAPTDERGDALYDAACCYALDARIETAVATLEAALGAGYWDAPQLAQDPDLAALHGHPRWAAIAARARTAFAAFERSLVDPALRRHLLTLAARVEAAGEPSPEATQTMRDAIAKHGWPGKRIVGADGASAAWVLAQHSDDIPFQRHCVALMEPLVRTGEVAGRDYAALFDRVAIREGRAQRYGTQRDGDDLAPLEDPANVDARREAVGLEPLKPRSRR